MKQERITEGSSWIDPRGQVMKTPDDVAEMLPLRACGWGLKRIARQLGCGHHTVKGYVVAGGVKAFKSPERPKRLDGLEGWLRETLVRHRGNADVVRQDLLAEKGVTVSRRTLQRAVQPYRQALKAEGRLSRTPGFAVVAATISGSSFPSPNPGGTGCCRRPTPPEPPSSMALRWPGRRSPARFGMSSVFSASRPGGSCNHLSYNRARAPTSCPRLRLPRSGRSVREPTIALSVVLHPSGHD
ncbi:hypothetical protein IVA87_11145 [Bradyrhizobium sp. 147]|nr:hypothetical protein [Bradyrhizobium sp. 147]